MAAAKAAEMAKCENESNQSKRHQSKAKIMAKNANNHQ